MRFKMTYNLNVMNKIPGLSYILTWPYQETNHFGSSWLVLSTLPRDMPVIALQATDWDKDDHWALRNLQAPYPNQYDCYLIVRAIT